MNEKRNLWLPVALMLAFAAARWPGLMPQNFSAVYALVFCAGVYLPARLWWLPLVTMATTDIALNIYFAAALGIDSFKATQLVNYAAYLIMIWAGRRIGPNASFMKLLGGGVLGAILFYLLTNTAAWFFNPFGNPEYTRNLMGWFIALTKGTSGYMATWEFFRNTLLSGGLFTGLFVGAVKLSTRAESPVEKELTEPNESEEPAAEEAKA